MTRHAPLKRRAQRRISEVVWKSDHKQFFSLAADDWTPPARVRVTKSSPRRMTFEARFTPADGTPVILKTRVALLADGSGEVLEETMSMRFLVKAVGNP